MNRKWETKDNTNTEIQRIKDIDTVNRKVVLYAASWDTLDSHNDRMAKGCAKKTISENGHRVKHLMHHKTDHTIGVPESMEEDNVGLLVVSKISDTVLGRDAMTLIVDKVLTENSVGFQTVKEEKSGDGSRVIKEIILWEYSSVTWGSNQNTPNLAVKSMHGQLDHELLFKELTMLQKHLRTGNLSDETCYLLELKVVQIQQAIADYIQSLETKEPEIISTPELVAEPIIIDTKAIEVSELYKAWKNIK